MSAITEYVRLRPHELTKLRSLLVDDPDEACEYAGDLRMGDEDEEVSSRGTDTDKAWPCLQCLLAKAGAPIDVIGGGEPVTDDVWGYDSPRLLTVTTSSTTTGTLCGSSTRPLPTGSQSWSGSTDAHESASRPYSTMDYLALVMSEPFGATRFHSPPSELTPWPLVSPAAVSPLYV